MSVTPEQVEKRLLELSKEVDEAHEKLREADSTLVEKEYMFKKSMAEARVRLSHSDQKMRVQEIDDRALIMNEQHYLEYLTAQHIVRASKSNSERVQTQVTIAQSVGASVRASLNII